MKVHVLSFPPTANAGRDTTVSINDVIHLHGSGTDVHGDTAVVGFIVKYEWDIGATGTFRQARPDTAIIAPATANNAYRSVLRVTDDDGNTACDTVSDSVVLDPPVLHMVNDTVPMGSLDTLHCTVTQRFGTIAKWEWAIDTDAFKQTSGNNKGSDTVITVPSVYMTRYRCRVRCTDDDGNTTIDSLNVVVGSQWKIVGTAGISGSTITDLHLKTYSASLPNALYVSYLDQDAFSPHVAKWAVTTSTWNTQAPPLPPPSIISTSPFRRICPVAD